MDCLVCGRKVNVHWLGSGDYCSEHFKEEYINKYGDEEKTESKEKELLGKEVR